MKLSLKGRRSQNYITIQIRKGIRHKFPAYFTMDCEITRITERTPSNQATSNTGKVHIK